MGVFTQKISNLFTGTGDLINIEDINSLGFGNDFSDVLAASMYSKIILECADRAILSNKIDKSGYTLTVYDSFSPYKYGLCSWIVYAIVSMKTVYLKINKTSTKGVFTFKKVPASEAVNDNKLNPGYMELDFSEFKEARIIKLLFKLLSNVMIAMSKGVTASQSLILKINKLSEMIANGSNNDAIEQQIKNINSGVREGKSSYIDAASSVDFVVYDSSKTSEATSFILSMVSMLTGLPSSYLFAEVVTGLGSNSDGDNVRFNTALRRYFYSIFNGAYFNVYGESVEFKPMVADINSLISAFTFIETTTSLTDEGKLKFMVNNTGFNKEDFAFGKSSGSDK